MMRRLLTIALLALAVLPRADAASALSVDASGRQHLGAHIELFHDVGGDADLDQVEALAARGGFRDAETRVPGLGYHAGAWWVRFRLHNPGSRPVQRWLLLDWPLQHVAKLHLVPAHGPARAYASGYRVPIAERPLHSGQLLFPVKIAAGGTLTGYLRLSGKSLSIANLSLWDPAVYAATEARQTALRFFLLGTVFVVMHFSVLAASVRRRPALLLGGVADFLLFGGLFLLEGHGVGWFPAGDELWMGRTLSLLTFTIAACYFGFIRSFLDLPRSHPWLATACGVLGWSALGLGLLFLLWLNQALARLFVAACFLSLLAVCVAAARGSSANARLLLLAWGINLLGVLVVWASSDSSLAGLSFRADIPFVGVAGAALVLSYALYRDIREVRAQVERSREALLARQGLENRQLTEIVEKRTREVDAARNLADDLLQERSVMIAMLGHELRSPLHVVLGYTRLLERQVSEKGERFRAIVERSANRVLQTLDEMTAVTSADTVDLEVAPAPCPLDALVREAATYGRLLSRQTAVEFVVDVDPSLPRWVVADRRRVVQVLHNLLANAFKYTPRGRVRLGALALEATGDGDALIEFAVTDDGIGVPVEVRQRIFEPFFRAPGLELQPGIGLGLAFSQRLLRAMGSEFSLDSQPGAGSRFSFVLRLPVMEAAPDAALVPAGPGDGTPRHAWVDNSASQRDASAAPRPRLSAADLAEFGEFLDRGEVLAIERWAARLATRAPDCRALGAEIVARCRAVDLRGLEALHASLESRTLEA